MCIVYPCDYLSAPSPRGWRGLGAVRSAHSLGSVVAYETLHAHPELGVNTFITLGSPLGMPSAVFDVLDPAPVEGRGQCPPGVTSWTNIADAGDLVALPRRLGDRFPVTTHQELHMAMADFQHSVCIWHPASPLPPSLHTANRRISTPNHRDDVHEAFLDLVVCLITHRHVQRPFSGRTNRNPERRRGWSGTPAVPVVTTCASGNRWALGRPPRISAGMSRACRPM